MIHSVLRTRAARCTARRPFPLLTLLLALAAGMLSFADSAAAQTVTGRVVRAGAGVPNAPVELHRVATDTSGLLATGTADGQGRFTFTLPQVDSGGFTVFFATAMVEGVRYFGPALHPGDTGTSYVVAVYDTTSAKPALDALRVGRRDVIVVAGQRGDLERAATGDRMAGRHVHAAGHRHLGLVTVDADLLAADGRRPAAGDAARLHHHDGRRERGQEEHRVTIGQHLVAHHGPPGALASRR